ncbi:homeobox-domain-containing protein [Paxillus ammoniavirescens]|nr:homeobox-domain-containing protein [Paxillus ammoniavirescens]
MQSNSLSRTSSVASISSDDAARRTRKRFTSVQLMMLEQLFHQTSHPTREEREAVAQTAGMEMKSVTIWFQNKRQTERKVALHHATTQSNTEGHRQAPFPSSSSHATASSSSTPSHSIRSSHARTLSTSSVHTPLRKITPPRPRPSLDRVAARSESRLPPPRTPTKPRNPHASLWDNMPSSPLAAPVSPPSRDLVEFMGTSRTLEWACAAARLAGKEGRGGTASGRLRGGDAGDETEEEDTEAITPDGSLGSSDIAWRAGTRLPTPPHKRKLESPDWSGSAKNIPQDDDMMRAALALCGLGQRSR